MFVRICVWLRLSLYVFVWNFFVVVFIDVIVVGSCGKCVIDDVLLRRLV